MKRLLTTILMMMVITMLVMLSTVGIWKPMNVQAEGPIARTKTHFVPLPHNMLCATIWATGYTHFGAPLRFGAPLNELPFEVILFEHINFRGAHKHVFGEEINLAAEDDNFFNDRVSSFVIVSGFWQFYRHVEFQDPYRQPGNPRFPVRLGPGAYPNVVTLGITNDDMSSLSSFSTPDPPPLEPPPPPPGPDLAIAVDCGGNMLKVTVENVGDVQSSEFSINVSATRRLDCCIADELDEVECPERNCFPSQTRESEPLLPGERTEMTFTEEFRGCFETEGLDRPQDRGCNGTARVIPKVTDVNPGNNVAEIECLPF